MMMKMIPSLFYVSYIILILKNLFIFHFQIDIFSLLVRFFIFIIHLFQYNLIIFCFIFVNSFSKLHFFGNNKLLIQNYLIIFRFFHLFCLFLYHRDLKIQSWRCNYKFMILSNHGHSIFIKKLIFLNSSVHSVHYH